VCIDSCPLHALFGLPYFHGILSVFFFQTTDTHKTRLFHYGTHGQHKHNNTPTAQILFDTVVNDLKREAISLGLAIEGAPIKRSLMSPI
jgi:hypothetical protein